MQKEIRPAVAAIVFNHAGEVLLHKRRDVGRWSVLSGHVEFGESVSAAVLREIREEIYVDAAIIRLIGVYSAPATQTYHYEDKSVHFVTTYFEVQLLGALPDHVSNSETMEAGYFPIDNLPPEMDLLNPHWLEDALNPTAGPFIR
jgi:ADP-ribose pyrophosphatase YjhB (NUDIX family)